MPGSDVNEAVARIVAGRLAGKSMVRHVETFPREKPDRVVVYVDASHYPAAIEDVTVDFRFGSAGDINVVYVERWAGVEWSCRWDRHENPHSDIDHFHPPPDPDDETIDALDAAYPDGPTAIVGMVLSALEDRHGTLWKEVNDPTYPSEYVFDADDCELPFLID